MERRSLQGVSYDLTRAASRRVFHNTTAQLIKKYKEAMPQQSFETCVPVIPTSKPREIARTLKNPVSLPRSNVKTTTIMKNMNADILVQRKENHLATCFNLRKNKLKIIESQNKLLYQRLNSQRSLYSSTDLNKSCSSRSSMRKSSLSKMSNRSKKSSGKVGSNQEKRRKKPSIQIRAANVATAPGDFLSGFKQMFAKKTVARRVPPGFNQRNHKSFNEPGANCLLHRIAEEMFEKQRDPEALRPQKKQRVSKSHGDPALGNYASLKNHLNF